VKEGGVVVRGSGECGKVSVVSAVELVKRVGNGGK